MMQSANVRIGDSLGVQNVFCFFWDVVDLVNRMLFASEDITTPWSFWYFYAGSSQFLFLAAFQYIGNHRIKPSLINLGSSATRCQHFAIYPQESNNETTDPEVTRFEYAAYIHSLPHVRCIVPLLYLRAIMSRYKLTYFPIRGRAECIRMVFAVAGVEFENVRVNPEEWFTKLKQCEYYNSSFLFLVNASI